MKFLKKFKIKFTNFHKIIQNCCKIKAKELRDFCFTDSLKKVVYVHLKQHPYRSYILGS
jgi:hypothetical protein